MSMRFLVLGLLMTMTHCAWRYHIPWEGGWEKFPWGNPRGVTCDQTCAIYGETCDVNVLRDEVQAIADPVTAMDDTDDELLSTVFGSLAKNCTWIARGNWGDIELPRLQRGAINAGPDELWCVFPKLPLRNTPFPASYCNEYFTQDQTDFETCVPVCWCVAPPPSPPSGAVIELTGQAPKIIFGGKNGDADVCELTFDSTSRTIASTCPINESNGGRRVEEQEISDAHTHLKLTQKIASLSAKYESVESALEALQRSVDELSKAK